MVTPASSVQETKTEEDDLSRALTKLVQDVEEVKVQALNETSGTVIQRLTEMKRLVDDFSKIANEETYDDREDITKIREYVKDLQKKAEVYIYVRNFLTLNSATNED